MPFRVEAAPPGVFFCVDPFKATSFHVRGHVRPLRWATPWTHMVFARKGGRYGGVGESERPSRAQAGMYDDTCVIHAEQTVAAAQWTGKRCQQGGSSRMGPFQRLVRRGRWGHRPSEEADSGSTDLGQPSPVNPGREACESVPLSARLLPTMSRGHLPNDRDPVAGLGLFPL